MCNKGYMLLDSIIASVIISIILFGVSSMVFSYNMLIRHNNELMEEYIWAEKLDMYYLKDDWEGLESEYIEEYVSNTGYNTEQIKLKFDDNEYLLERRIDYE